MNVSTRSCQSISEFSHRKPNATGFTTLSDERRSRSKIFPLFIWIKEPCVRKFEWLERSKLLGISQTKFRRELLGRIRLPKRPTSNIYDIEGGKLLTRLKVEFSGLRKHRYRHNFHCHDPTCLCQTGIEDNEHFLLPCPRFSSQQRVLFDLVSKSVNFDIMCLSSKELCNLLLCGHSKCTIITNRVIIESTLEHLKSTGRFKKKSRFS